MTGLFSPQLKKRSQFFRCLLFSFFLLVPALVSAQSSNSTLATLTTSDGTLSPAFSPGTTSYTITVPFSTIYWSYTDTKGQANSTMRTRLNGGSYTIMPGAGGHVTEALNVGVNTYEIEVTAQDGVSVTTFTGKSSQGMP